MFSCSAKERKMKIQATFVYDPRRLSVQDKLGEVRHLLAEHFSSDSRAISPADVGIFFEPCNWGTGIMPHGTYGILRLEVVESLMGDLSDWKIQALKQQLATLFGTGGPRTYAVGVRKVEWY